ncbi:hypothetical protein RJ639_018772 [Escallonia herrerae]|uniref:Uncharacterized protein n=1 Tax=Escallonia herrerae TaxID=1293975 RepID=A0AA88V6W8_9ASTE|nr:hypothetical protein RJ639_018772 [Escallonia herrerae]
MLSTTRTWTTKRCGLSSTPHLPPSPLPPSDLTSLNFYILPQMKKFIPELASEEEVYVNHTIGKYYTTYKCSPPVTGHTKGTLTINSFEKGGDGGGPSEYDNQYHSDDKLVVALSTGWFDNRSSCLNYITIHGNGRSVKAQVVDECDSTMGCDNGHGYQPACPNYIVVWKALGVPESDWGGLDISWSDA